MLRSNNSTSLHFNSSENLLCVKPTKFRLSTDMDVEVGIWWCWHKMWLARLLATYWPRFNRVVKVQTPFNFVKYMSNVQKLRRLTRKPFVFLVHVISLSFQSSNSRQSFQAHNLLSRPVFFLFFPLKWTASVTVIVSMCFCKRFWKQQFDQTLLLNRSQSSQWVRTTCNVLRVRILYQCAYIARNHKSVNTHFVQFSLRLLWLRDRLFLLPPLRALWLAVDLQRIQFIWLNCAPLRPFSVRPIIIIFCYAHRKRNIDCGEWGNRTT